MRSASWVEHSSEQSLQQKDGWVLECCLDCFMFFSMLAENLSHTDPVAFCQSVRFKVLPLLLSITVSEFQYPMGTGGFLPSAGSASQESLQDGRGIRRGKQGSLLLIGLTWFIWGWLFCSLALHLVWHIQMAVIIRTLLMWTLFLSYFSALAGITREFCL